MEECWSWRFCRKTEDGGHVGVEPYRGTSLTSKRTPLGPYRRLMSRVLGGSSGDGRFLMGEVPLYQTRLMSSLSREHDTVGTWDPSADEWGGDNLKSFNNFHPGPESGPDCLTCAEFGWWRGGAGTRSPPKGQAETPPVPAPSPLEAVLGAIRPALGAVRSARLGTGRAPLGTGQARLGMGPLAVGGRTRERRIPEKMAEREGRVQQGQARCPREKWTGDC